MPQRRFLESSGCGSALSVTTGPCRASCSLRARLGVEELSVDYNAVLDLAATTGLTAYDASYLWLAQQIGAELLTLDKQLANAATAR